MATSTRPGLRRDGPHLRAVLGPLVSSMRGQIFLSNLEAALPLLPLKSVRDALLSVQTKDARRMHEDDYLPHLRSRLQDLGFGLLLNIKSPGFAQFSPDGWVVNVLPFVSYQAHYEDPVASLAGHTGLTKTPGTSTSNFRASAATAPFFWIAARAAIAPPEVARSNAQSARDLLGLVHYGMKSDLVAMHLRLTGPVVFRPTAIEANPNARFRHTDPKSPTETRWGRTIHLDLLEFFNPGDEIGGIPELVAYRTRLADCDSVEFYYLGTTSSDRSTTGTDRKFLTHVLNGRHATGIAKSIIYQLAP